MIRDRNQIYGEPNDPSTVLSETELPSGCFVVGIGNRGVKKFEPGNSKLVITDKYGNASSLPYNSANKVVGTDEDGNLVMRDLPHQYTFFKFGGTNSVVRLNASSDGVTYSIVDRSESVLGNAKVYVSKNAGAAVATKFTVTFDTPLTLTSATEVTLCAAVGFGSAVKDFKLLDTYDNAISLNSEDESGMCCCNRTITLPAGTYKQLQFTESEPDNNYNNRALYISCLICY